jgi:AcrR family transcriptional regulator
VQDAGLSQAPEPRERILRAARHQFERFGYRRANVGAIAGRAGVAAGTLYRYFENKEALFRQVVAQCAAEWDATARAVVEGPGTALERLVRLGEESVRFSQESVIQRSILTRDTEIIFAPLIDEFDYQFGRINVEAMTRILREAIAEGSVRDLDPEKTAFVLFLAGTVLIDQKYFPYEEVLAVYQDLVLNGLKPR